MCIDRWSTVCVPRNFCDTHFNGRQHFDEHVHWACDRRELKWFCSAFDEPPGRGEYMNSRLDMTCATVGCYVSCGILSGDCAVERMLLISHASNLLNVRPHRCAPKSTQCISLISEFDNKRDISEGAVGGVSDVGIKGRDRPLTQRNKPCCGPMTVKSSRPGKNYKSPRPSLFREELHSHQRVLFACADLKSKGTHLCLPQHRTTRWICLIRGYGSSDL